MYEYLSEAIVLHYEPRGELNTRVSFFTKKYGKLSGRATSSRKITSKLASHLQPGNLIQLRMVERGGVQIVDALKKERLPITPAELYNLDHLLAEAEADPMLWEHLASGEFAWSEVLRILGWDPEEGACRLCRRNPHAFRVRDQEFFCERCAFRVAPNEVIFIYSN